MAVATDDVHRLRDILVEEVSLVDRAANKRRFLLVKREGDMSELRADGRGGFIRVRKADEDDPDDEDTEKAKAKKPNPFAKKPNPFAKKPPKPPEPPDDPADDADDDDEDTEKAKGKKPFPGAAKPFGSKKKPAPDEDEDEDDEDAEKADDDDEDEEKDKRAAKAANSSMADKIGDIVDELKALAESLDDDDDDPSDVNMKKLLAAHRKLGTMADAYMKRAAKKSIQVTKIGRKMSASRLAMYKEALATLQSLLSDLMDSPKKDKDHAADPGDPQVAPPGFKAANPSGAPTNATGAAAMKAIEKSFGEITTLLQGQAKKIARLEKGVGPSSAMTVDGAVRKGAAVAWPIDVNAPPRDKIGKDVSFYDD